ncbi:MAG: DUF1614 domain-containing protein [Methanothrix sp.]|uniref:DUF1614 domain-containing protein n=1 Tax=Methanothrix sp. TaxID=90426 RepID=UPI0019C303DD|nr:DUF1614 domain-containing protein [Methanothrix sp.]MBC7079898.1 DUF1614 domain-containing protein [Methanothrix sp.]NPU88048.1 DUF1614 domain-containing protein [Methanothrix sp.]
MLELMIPFFLLLVILLLALPLIFIYLFIRITEEAFEQIGFGHWHASLMVFGSIIGSMIDIPLHSGVITTYPAFMVDLMGTMDVPVSFHPVRLLVNVGGCIVPVLVSIDLLRRHRAPISIAVFGALVVAFITYTMAEPVPNVGITLPVYVPPISAALAAVILCRGYRTAPAIAYISGSIGTLLGADVMNLFTPGVLPALAPPSAYPRPLALSIGGAGIFDGIFLTGVMAVLLASLVVYLLGGGSCRSRRISVS